MASIPLGHGPNQTKTAARVIRRRWRIGSRVKLDDGRRLYRWSSQEMRRFSDRRDWDVRVLDTRAVGEAG